MKKMILLFFIPFVMQLNCAGKPVRKEKPKKVKTAKTKSELEERESEKLRKYIERRRKSPSRFMRESYGPMVRRGILTLSSLYLSGLSLVKM